MKIFSVFKNKESYEKLRERTRRETTSQTIRDSEYHGSFALAQRLASLEKWKQWDGQQGRWRDDRLTGIPLWVYRFSIPGLISWRIWRLFKK